eukprot:scaffold357406_cov40-Prasinocladus_malaysianus.AAC.1
MPVVWYIICVRLCVCLAEFGCVNGEGVHNFTDGMAIGAAFLRGGAALGWARSIIIMAHELPQEIGDYGLLVGAGFSAAKALAWNFVSVRWKAVEDCAIL